MPVQFPDSITNNEEMQLRVKLSEHHVQAIGEN